MIFGILNANTWINQTGKLVFFNVDEEELWITAKYGTIPIMSRIFCIIQRKSEEKWRLDDSKIYCRY